MTNQILKGALVAGTLAVGLFTQTDSASAASMIYDFEQFGAPVIDAAPSSFTAGGVTVNVSTNNDGIVTQTADGLGVARIFVGFVGADDFSLAVDANPVIGSSE